MPATLRLPFIFVESIFQHQMSTKPFSQTPLRILEASIDPRPPKYTNAGLPHCSPAFCPEFVQGRREKRADNVIKPSLSELQGDQWSVSID